MKRFVSFLCAMAMICVFACPIAQASGDGQITPHTASCPECGGDTGYKNNAVRTSEVFGYHNNNKATPHYKAYLYREWRCDSCGTLSREKIAEGFYCSHGCASSSSYSNYVFYY